MNEITDITSADVSSLRGMIYTVRGKQVMLDSDLAEIYGYETKYFNRQIKNNESRFAGDDFMFRLTKEEYSEILRCKKSTSRWGGERYLPHVFTEQGVYMLMTVLRGDLAVKQSRALIMLFKAMKDHIIGNGNPLITQGDYYSLARKVESNTEEIREIRDALGEKVARADLSEFMMLFDEGTLQEEVLVLEGTPFKADLAYQSIYGEARKQIILVDDYIGIKTLQHLSHAQHGVHITIASDNRARPPLRWSEYCDFMTENPDLDVDFVTTRGMVHDRYILLDPGTDNMMIYHCGASSKDAGKRITTIARLKDPGHEAMIKRLIANPPLNLR